ncbi:hypothetical protein [Thiomicrospira microaerophila]|uniref:hypothetical protein n=1 Tax=Thiomicrospira microaerophila TaxID=406020 RepID=UPI0005C889CD|nr:hypothetical protein [Thiomicrospira microaerophila]
MYTDKIMNILINQNLNETLNKGRLNKLDDTEAKAVKDIAFFSFQEAQIRLDQIESISNALTTALHHTDEGIFNPIKDGLQIAHWLTSEARTLQALLSMHEESLGVERTQGRLCQNT